MSLMSIFHRNYPIAEIEDCAIAVDASYYFQLLLHSDDGSGQSFEPLLPALGGMTGIVKRIEDDLDQWANHRVTPLFVFDGQVVEGQDEISRMRGRKALEQTQKAWDLYFGNQAIEAVTTFGSNIGKRDGLALLGGEQDTNSMQELSGLRLSTLFFKRS